MLRTAKGLRGAPGGPVRVLVVAIVSQDTDGLVTDPAFDCSVTPPCSDPGLWEIGGPTGVLAYDRYYEDSDWAARVGQLPITGVMMYRFDRRRIMPRSGSDFP